MYYYHMLSQHLLKIRRKVSILGKIEKFRKYLFLEKIYFFLAENV